MESKPIDTITKYIMNWNYDGVNIIYLLEKILSDIDAAKQFATEYIKILKEK